MLTIIQKENILKTRELFIKHFNEEPTDFFKSCGRLEIIGNHTDYNCGTVITSSAGNLNILSSAKMSDDNKIVIKSEGYPDLVVDLADIEFREEEKETSTAFVKGIVSRFKQLGYSVGGFKLEMMSTIYKGGGVSSSAAYCVLICKILSYYYNNDSLDSVTMAKISKWSENNYFGKGSGLLDQIGCCSKGFVRSDFLDQENPVINECSVNLGNYKILLLDTKTDHSESQGGFQQLVSDMHEVAEYFGVDYLIQVSKERFMEEYNKPEHIGRRNWDRAYHFMTEVERVDRAYKALQANDIEAFLVEITASGLSSELKLKNIVSEGHETNNLLEALHLGRASIKKGAIRVHGGGFGGTCLIFIDKDEEAEFKQLMSVKFPLEQFVEVEPSNNPLVRLSPEEVGL